MNTDCLTIGIIHERLIGNIYQAYVHIYMIITRAVNIDICLIEVPDLCVFIR